MDPPTPMSDRVVLNDDDNDTCISLADTDMYTFSRDAHRWIPQPLADCWEPGLSIIQRVPDGIKTTFSVAITGHRIACSHSRLTVMIKQADYLSCDLAGHYLVCEMSEAVESDELTTCTAKCSCDRGDCRYMEINILDRHDDWELCEIYMK